MWERWNGDQMRNDPSMNSYNHYAYGAVADWIYRYAAGVDATPLDAGFHTIVLHPVFDARLGHRLVRLRLLVWPHSLRLDGDGQTADVACDDSREHHRLAALSADEAAKYKLDGAPLVESKQAKAASLRRAKRI